jgi:hypothetical protein
MNTEATEPCCYRLRTGRLHALDVSSADSCSTIASFSSACWSQIRMYMIWSGVTSLRRAYRFGRRFCGAATTPPRLEKIAAQGGQKAAAVAQQLPTSYVVKQAVKGQPPLRNRGQCDSS